MFATSTPSAFTNGIPYYSQTNTGYGQIINVSYGLPVRAREMERWAKLPDRASENLEEFHEAVEQDRLYRAQVARERIRLEQTLLRRARPRLLLSASRPRVPVVQLTRSRGQAPRATR